MTKIRTVALLSFSLSLFLITGCSEKTEEELETTFDSTASTIGRAAEEAADTVGSKLQNIGDDNDTNHVHAPGDSAHTH